jgi:hypothetical protein
MSYTARDRCRGTKYGPSRVQVCSSINIVGTCEYTEIPINTPTYFGELPRNDSNEFMWECGTKNWASKGILGRDDYDWSQESTKYDAHGFWDNSKDRPTNACVTFNGDEIYWKSEKCAQPAGQK